MVATLAGLATWANLDLTANRAFLFMDEMIPFDNVKRILAADSWHSFWWEVSDGGDHRYGRIFYNVSALFSDLPYRWYGDPGLIFGIRCTQVFLLLTSYVVLCRSLLRTWTARAVGMFTLGCLPFTSYYLMMPKPEPLQLLLLAYFFALSQKRHFALGGHWIILGLAFGTKISAAPICCLAGMTGLASAWLEHTRPWVLFKKAALSVGAFISGWLIAIPFLAVPSRDHFDQYLNWTFRATTHPADDASVNVLVWLRSLTDRTFAINYYLPKEIALPFAVTLICYVIFQIIVLLKLRPRLREMRFNRGAWILLGYSIALMVPIVFLVKRVWGLYLHTGEVFGAVALVAIAEKDFLLGDRQSIWKKLSWYGSCAMGASSLFACCGTFPRLLNAFHTGANRTTLPAHIRQANIYQDVLPRLQAFALALRQQKLGHNPVLGYYDPALYLPSSELGMDVQPFWNHDINWKLGADFLVIGYVDNMDYLLGVRSLPPATSGRYLEIVKARDQFAASVDTQLQEHSSKPYCIAGWLQRDVVIIVKTELYDTWSRATKKFSPLAPALPLETEGK